MQNDHEGNDYLRPPAPRHMHDTASPNANARTEIHITRLLRTQIQLYVNRYSRAQITFQLYKYSRVGRSSRMRDEVEHIVYIPLAITLYVSVVVHAHVHYPEQLTSEACQMCTIELPECLQTGAAEETRHQPPAYPRPARMQKPTRPDYHVQSMSKAKRNESLTNINSRPASVSMHHV
jgi:hypothetical protein